MFVEQIYTKCLAEAAYYIESNGEVAIIDPIREVEPYIQMAKERAAKIKYVFETHFHADFVSGHIDLAKQTGATIVFGPNAEAGYDIYNGTDGEVFNIGDVSLTLLHTPGHTMESSCYLLKDSEGNQHGVFTGDTLFIGDVGRPDLAVKSGEITQDDLAGFMYDSLRNKLMKLPDHVIVYPAHGAGSSCGKNLGSETTSTIGEQKATNYALQPMSKEDFIQEVTDGLLAPPPYFFKDAMMNKNGYESIVVVVETNHKALSYQEFAKEIAAGAFILDTRKPGDFAVRHVKSAVNIGLNGQYAPWVGAIIPTDAKIVLVADQGKEKEAIVRLARVGYDYVAGFLDGGINAWVGEYSTIHDVSTEEGVELIKNQSKLILDVRKPVEVEAAHVCGSQHIRLQELPSRFSELEKDASIAIYCAGGYRSMIAASFLQKEGFSKITNIQGGFGKLKQFDIQIVEGQSCSDS
tara:strand:- start:811 stop:2202 length:1392 start_codon:yes stop_codon:yes gene_type:complete